MYSAAPLKTAHLLPRTHKTLSGCWRQPKKRRDAGTRARRRPARAAARAHPDPRHRPRSPSIGRGYRRRRARRRSHPLPRRFQRPLRNLSSIGAPSRRRFPLVTSQRRVMSVSDDAMRHIVSSTRARASPSPRSISIARTVEKNKLRRIRVASRRRRRRVPRARRIRILIRSRRSSRRRIESTRPREDEGDERDDRDDHATIARGDLISSRFPSRDAEGRRARDASVVDARG